MINNDELGRYGRKYTKEIDDFILAEYPIGNGCFIPLFNLINAIWYDRNCTVNGLKTHLSTVKIVNNPKKGNRKKSAPIGTERVMKDFVQIKTAKGFIQKSRWIYEQNHPDYQYKRGDCFIFLDGNTRNFDIENIELIDRRVQVVFLKLYGLKKGKPSLNKLNIYRAKLKVSVMDRAEKAGLVYKNRTGRILKKWK